MSELGLWPKPSPRKCLPCNFPLDIRTVQGINGPVEVSICPRCDLLDCKSCGKPAHELNQMNVTRCQQPGCGAAIR